MSFLHKDTWCRLRVAVLFLALQLVYFGRADTLSGGEDAWKMVMGLGQADGESFKSFVQPLVEMAANSYRYPYVVPIHGWTQIDAIAPIHGGMHAILYQDDLDSKRMVLSFRGTDVSGGESSVADLCAGALLWIPKSGGAPQPPDCSPFSSETLDYFKQAVDYTEKVLKSRPDSSLLLTGHSLGAGLALLVTAALDVNPSMPVVAFSAPGVKRVLERRNLKLSADQERRLFLISDQWDELVRMGWKDQVGTTCVYPTTLCTYCKLCMDAMDDASSSRLDNAIPNEEHECSEKDVPIDIDRIPGFSNECWACFLKTHILKHVMDLVDIGVKPICEFHTSESVISDPNHHMTVSCEISGVVFNSHDIRIQ